MSFTIIPNGAPHLSRSTSAPPMLDSNMLFAFPAARDYTEAFSDIRNDLMYEEFYEKFKAKLNIPPPLTDPLSLAIPEESSRKCSDVEETQNRSRSTSFLVTNIVNNCIKDEESPKNLKITPSQEFTNGFDDGFLPVYGFNNQHIYTHALEMSKDQLGCRMLQKKLEEKNPFTIQAIYEQIYLHVSEIMMDPFGNYFIQKLMEECEESIISDIIEIIKPQFVQISLDAHGTRAIQKLIEVIVLYPSQIPKVVNCLISNEVLLIKDTNGNHVIQKCLNVLKSPFNDFIYSKVCENIFDLATHRHGCCVLQRCIDAATISQRSKLIDKIIECAVELVQDAFGNYVVQYVIDLNTPEANSRLGLIFIQSMRLLATQKFSSNVIEKCLQQNSHDIQQLMIQEISQPGNIIKMISDQYANYVVQRALALAEPGLLAKMIKEIRGKSEELKRNQFGKRIFAKLMKKYPDIYEKSNGKKP